jgi:hypothetical protein
MGLWAKSVVIFNAICAHGKQSIRSLADRTGLSKSSVHRHLQAMDRRSNDHTAREGHCEEAKIRETSGYRILRSGAAMGSLLLPYAPSGCPCS